MHQDFHEQAGRLKAWTGTALERWARVAQDPKGGYCDRLFADGQPDFEHVRRVRNLTRTAYVYAHASHTQWYGDLKAASDHAWQAVLDHGLAGGARGCARLIQRDGSLHDAERDIYAQAFLLLAAAWRYRAFGDKAALALAEDTVAFLDEELKSPFGGWLESWPKTRMPRRQNPHMHLFEAFIALYDATGSATYKAHADHVFGLFEAHFWDPERQVLLEFFEEDLTPYRGYGGPVEPGHMMEWCWLLHEYARISDAKVADYCRALFQNGMALGLDTRQQLICDEVNLGDIPATPTFRAWPQAEFIKACIVQARNGQTDALELASRTIARMFDMYFNVETVGGWRDKLDYNGAPIIQTMPLSLFYHLFCMAAEVIKMSDDLKAS